MSTSSIHHASMTSIPAPPTSQSTRAQGCLAGLAVGNVLGLSAESRSRDETRARLGSEGPFPRLPLEEKDRDWDDDLAMAMALSECLLQLPLESDRLDLGANQSAYLGWLRSGSRGIGSLTREVLLKALAGEARAAERVWEARCKRGQRPLGNGAAMRIAPLGVAFSGRPHLVFELACQEATLTHWDPACRQSAALIALLTAALIRGERDPRRFALAHAADLLPEVREAAVPLSLDGLAARRVDGPDMGSTLLALKVAVTMMAAGLSFEEGLPWILRQGGDTDTNGAIVGALLGARDGYSAIPNEWLECIAEKDRIIHVGRRLFLRSGLVPMPVSR